MARQPESPEPPLIQFQNELKAVFHRWWVESDLDDLEMARAALTVAEEFSKSDIAFESDIDFDDE